MTRNLFYLAMVVLIGTYAITGFSSCKKEQPAPVIPPGIKDKVHATYKLNDAEVTIDPALNRRFHAYGYINDTLKNNTGTRITSYWSAMHEDTLSNYPYPGLYIEKRFLVYSNDLPTDNDFLNFFPDGIKGVFSRGDEPGWVVSLIDAEGIEWSTKYAPVSESNDEYFFRIEVKSVEQPDTATTNLKVLAKFNCNLYNQDATAKKAIKDGVYIGYFTPDERTKYYRP